MTTLIRKRIPRKKAVMNNLNAYLKNFNINLKDKLTRRLIDINSDFCPKEHTPKSVNLKCYNIDKRLSRKIKDVDSCVFNHDELIAILDCSINNLSIINMYQDIQLIKYFAYYCEMTATSHKEQRYFKDLYEFVYCYPTDFIEAHDFLNPK